MRPRRNAGIRIHREPLLAARHCHLLREVDPQESQLPQPSVTVAYTCASQSPSADTHAALFVDTLRRFPPGFAFNLVVICNGGPLPAYARQAFVGLDVQFFERGNDGWDIGGYIEFSRTSYSDILVCLGESVRFHKAGWLARIVTEWQKHGPGIYGCFSSYAVRAHLNTTAFAVSPWLLSRRADVRTREERYDFEHGESAFWRQLYEQGLEARLVTWDGSYEPYNWRMPPGILWRDEQQNCLLGSKITEQYRTGADVDRQRWARSADTLTERDELIEERRPKRGQSVCMVYIHLPHDNEHLRLANRFMESYRQFPPDFAHESLVVCNGSPPTRMSQSIFGSLPGLKFMVHDDSGWDIGAYQKAARETPCEMMVFCGGSTRFHRKGWLARMVSAFEQDRNALYGAMGNHGAVGARVYPHLRTNGFWCDPVMLNAYPKIIQGRGPSGDRYEFEHGKDGLTEWVRRQGLKAYMVTWDGRYEFPHWDSIPNGYHHGDQSNLLIKDRMTDPPYYHQT